MYGEHLKAKFAEKLQDVSREQSKWKEGNRLDVVYNISIPNLTKVTTILSKVTTILSNHPVVR